MPTEPPATAGEHSTASLWGHWCRLPKPSSPWSYCPRKDFAAGEALPTAKDAREGERQDLSLRSSKAGCRGQTTLLSAPVQQELEENEGGEGRDLKTFYSPGMLF